MKKSVAKSALGFRKFWGEGIEQTGGIAPLLLSAIFGVAAGFGSVGIEDMTRPLDNTPQAGQEQALQQYNAVLSVLAEQRNTLTGGQGDLPPGALSDLLGETKPAAETGDLDALRDNYKTQLGKFVTAVTIDNRLNEADVKDLMTRFETTHGDLKETTGFDKPDYDDLMESRARTVSIENEHDRAQKTINNSNEVNAYKVSGGLVGSGVFLLPWLLYFGAGAGRRRLENWEKGKPAPRKSGFNH